MPRRVVIAVLVAACAVLAAAAIGTPAQAAGPGTIIASENVGCPIVVVRARDFKRLRCYATPGLGRAALPLAVAPGGDRVAFYAEKNGAPGFDNGLYELSLRTGRVRELVPPSVGLRRSAEPAYSPDGLRLAFDGTEKQVAPAADYRLQLLTLATKARFGTGQESLDRPVFSPDGSRVFVADLGFRRTAVTSVSVTGGAPVGWGRLLDERLFPNGEQGLAMDLSPDGSRVALVAYISGDHVGLFMEAAGGEPQLVADGPPGAQGADVRWSPDGGLLAVQWHVYPSPGGAGIGGQLEFMAPDGSGRRTVPGVGFAGIAPSWAPDGSALVAPRSTTRAGRVGGGTVVVTRSGHVLVPRALAHTDYPAWAPPAAREIPPVLPPDPTPEPGTAAAIPPPLNDPRCTPSVTAGSAVAVASCFLRGDGGTFRSSGRVRVNGIDVTPQGSTIVVDPRRGVIRSTGTVEVRLGPIYLARRTIEWRVAAPLAFSVISAGKDPDPRDNTFGGLAVKGSIGIKFAGGRTVGTLSAALPGPFAGLTTDIVVAADNERGLVLDGLTMVLDGAVLGPAEVRDAKLVLSSEGGGRWEGGATFYPSKIQAFSVAGVLGFGVDGYLKLGGAVDGLNKPLVGGVFWQRARAELTFNPFSILGGLGVTYGPQIKLPGAGPISAASLDADFKYTDGDPASFELNGTGRVVNATFSGGVKVTTDGAVDANGALQWKDPIVSQYGIDAKIAGWYEQGAFDLSGSASLVLPGFDLGGEGVVSSAGIAGCRTGFGPSFGFGYRWQTRQLEVMASSCGIEPWRAARPSGGGRAAQVATAAFRVRGGRRTAVFSAIGTTAAPKITLTGPGVRVDTPPGPQDVVSTAKALLFQDQAQRTTYVAIDAPKGGTYHLAAAPGSSPVATYRSAEARVAVRITARTRRAGGRRRTLTYRARNLGGGSITFVEEGKGLRRVLGTTRRASGRLRFTPSPGAGGRRTIRAVVTQSGLPQSSRRVATFATGRIRPGRPQRVRIRRGSASATVTWRGARGASYRLLFTSSDGRRMRFAADPSRRTRRSLQIRAVPRTATIRVQVRRLAAEGGLSAASRATSRGRR